MRRFTIVLVALTLSFAACSGGDEEIAGVGDSVIRLSDIGALFEGDTLPIDDAFLETLFRLVAVEALTQSLAADFGAATDPAAVVVYLAEFEATMAEQGLTPAQFLGVGDASAEMVRFNAELLALRDAAVDQLVAAPGTVDALFADPATLTSVCVEHILVATLEEAESVQARLAAGEDFATVAGEVSLDTGAVGGDLGCAAAAGYVTEFAEAAMAAPLGEFTGPVQTEFGFHLLVVSERTTPTREQYLADPQAMLSDEEIGGLWTEWLNGVLQSADAWVAERYGTWTPIGIKAAEAGTTTTSSAG
ncbi:MAG: peptidylprolyl isomerase [Actinomycetota bacterium]